MKKIWLRIQLHIPVSFGHMLFSLALPKTALYHFKIKDDLTVTPLSILNVVQLLQYSYCKYKELYPVGYLWIPLSKRAEEIPCNAKTI